MTTAPPPVYLPARVRAICYLVYAVLTAACSAAAAGFLAADNAVPIWLKVTSAVVVSLGTPLGLLAAANTTRKTPEPKKEPKEHDLATKPVEHAANGVLASTT